MGAIPTSLLQLDAIQRRASRIVDIPANELDSLQIQPLAQHRAFGAASLFHRIYHGNAPDLLSEPRPEPHKTRLRRSIRSKDLAVKVPSSILVSHKRSFLPGCSPILCQVMELPSNTCCFKSKFAEFREGG